MAEGFMSSRLPCASRSFGFRVQGFGTPKATSLAKVPSKSRPSPYEPYKLNPVNPEALIINLKP